MTREFEIYNSGENYIHDIESERGESERETENVNERKRKKETEHYGQIAKHKNVKILSKSLFNAHC